MISVAQAKEKILSNIDCLATVDLDLSDAQGFALAEEIKAPFALPSFRQSAMDGFAVNMDRDLSTFKCIGEIAAGSSKTYVLKKGEGVRIFTGAAVPDSANAVVMQEWVEVKEDSGQVLCSVQTDRKVNEGDHIRPIGEQLKSGDSVASKNTLVNGGLAALLQSFGVQQVKVFRKPKIAIVVTGDELVEPGNTLEQGQIYESNSVSLGMTLEEKGFAVTHKISVKDNYDELLRILAHSLDEHDLLIVSGGISVGKYDLVGKALKELKVKEVFYKVKQKPGKPLYYGRRDQTLVFALPGNPAASLTCLYEYVLPAIKKQSGYVQYLPLSLLLPLKHVFVNKGDRAKFLKATISNSTVEILDGQASSMLHSFALANGLVFLPEEIGNQTLEAGTMVETHLL